MLTIIAYFYIVTGIIWIFPITFCCAPCLMLRIEAVKKKNKWYADNPNLIKICCCCSKKMRKKGTTDDAEAQNTEDQDKE